MKILFLIFSYLLGAFPSGYVFFWMTDRKDIRDFGSGSTGATNFARVKGFVRGIPVMLIDILKGALPVYCALRFFPELEVALLAALLAVLGHCFPVYLKFRGGKGVATSVGALAVFGIKPVLLTLGTFILVIVITRYVSLGSILSTLCFPLFAFILKSEKEIILLGVVFFGLVFIRHSGNIQRLIEGSEKKLGERVQ